VTHNVMANCFKLMLGYIRDNFESASDALFRKDLHLQQFFGYPSEASNGIVKTRFCSEKIKSPNHTSLHPAISITRLGYRWLDL
jgi:hypothetical protein